MALTARCIIVLCAFALLGAGSSCDQISKKLNIPANFAGVVIDKNGVPQGYVSVQLFSHDTNRVEYQETTEDSGNFFFEKIDPGKYTVKVLQAGKTEMPADFTELNLLSGKTETKTITVSMPAPGGGAAGGTTPDSSSGGGSSSNSSSDSSSSGSGDGY